MSSVWHSHVIRMSLVCTNISLVYHSYVLLCHRYVTRMYPYVIRMSLVCIRMSSVRHSYVLAYHPYVTRMYLYVICITLVCTRMSSVGHSYVLVCTRMSSVCDSYVVLPWSVCFFVIVGCLTARRMVCNKISCNHKLQASVW